MCERGRVLTESMHPATDPALIETKLQETLEMKEILEFEEATPLEMLEKIEPLIGKIRVEGSMLDGLQLKQVSDFQKLILALYQYRSQKEEKYPKVVGYLKQLSPLPELISRIDQAIDHTGEIKDSASDKLRRIRIEKNQARAIIINRLRKDECTPALSELKADTGADYLVTLPESLELSEMGEDGKSLWSISQTNAVVERLDAFLEKLQEQKHHGLHGLNP